MLEQVMVDRWHHSETAAERTVLALRVLGSASCSRWRSVRRAEPRRSPPAARRRPCGTGGVGAEEPPDLHPQADGEPEPREVGERAGRNDCGRGPPVRRKGGSAPRRPRRRRGSLPRRPRGGAPRRGATAGSRRRRSGAMGHLRRRDGRTVVLSQVRRGRRPIHQNCGRANIL